MATRQDEKNKEKIGCKGKLEEQVTVSFKIGKEEASVYARVAQYFHEDVDEYLLEALRRDTKGLLENPDFLGESLSRELLDTLRKATKGK